MKKLKEHICRWKNAMSVGPAKRQESRAFLHRQFLGQGLQQARADSLQGLRRETPTKMVNGERHYLLHRGLSFGRHSKHDEYATKTHVHLGSAKSFTPFSRVASANAHTDAGYSAATRRGATIGGVSFGAWVPESKISVALHHLPKEVQPKEMENSREAEAIVGPGK